MSGFFFSAVSLREKQFITLIPWMLNAPRKKNQLFVGRCDWASQNMPCFSKHLMLSDRFKINFEEYG